MAALKDSVKSSVASSNNPHVRRLQPFRFFIGLLLSTLGIATILLVGVSLLQFHRYGKELALPMVAVSILVGVFLLGGGFGIMATAAAGSDELEFDRLMKVGETQTNTTVAVTEQSSSVPKPPAPSPPTKNAA